MLLATNDAVRSRRTWGIRALVASFVLALAAGSGLATAEPVEATNWSSRIAATRASQLTYEASMLAADRQLRELKQDRKRTQRKLKKARRTLARVRARRVEVRGRLTDSRAALRLALIAREVTEPEPAAQALAQPVKLVAADDAAELTTLVPPHIVLPDGLPPVDEPEPMPVGWALAQAIHAAARAEVRTLQRRVRVQQRTHRKVVQKLRRAQRNHRGRRSHLAAIKRQRRAAIARRGAAEAALKSHILSMSDLAERRALKKTKVRPGRNTPFVWPVRGRISQGYGCTGFGMNPSRGSCRHFHDGIDIVAGSGTPIRSAGVGVVSYLGRNPWDRGKRAFMVVVAHPGGFETLYGHVLPIRRVKVGQLVRKGEVIAYMGSTGHSTGTHLHLELRRGNITLSPLAYL